MNLASLVTATFFSLSSVPVLMEQGQEIKAQVTPDVTLRLMHWHSASPAFLGVEAPSIVILQGRASFIEKHAETIHDFRNLGFDVWAFDWRGQGGSTRLVDHPQKNHINHYDDYLEDLDYVLQNYVIPSARGPVILLGSSMGGHVALRYLANKQENSSISAAVLTAPMLDIPTDPFPRFIARSLVWAASNFGFGDSYAVGYGDYDPTRFKFESNKTTHDPRRFQRQQDICKTYIHYVTGGPTYDWVEATFQSVKTLLAPETLSRLTVPIFMTNSTNDKMVDNTVDRKSCAQMPGCTLKTYQAKHNILVETDAIRNQFFKDTLDFLKATLPSAPKWANTKGHPACPKLLTPAQKEELYQTGGIIYKGRRLQMSEWSPRMVKNVQQQPFTTHDRINAYARSAFVDDGVLICTYRTGFGPNHGPPWAKIDLNIYNFQE
jgi:lysophospholipase